MICLLKKQTINRLELFSYVFISLCICMGVFHLFQGSELPFMRDHFFITATGLYFLGIFLRIVRFWFIVNSKSLGFFKLSIGFLFAISVGHLTSSVFIGELSKIIILCFILRNPLFTIGIVILYTRLLDFLVLSTFMIPLYQHFSSIIPWILFSIIIAFIIIIFLLLIPSFTDRLNSLIAKKMHRPISIRLISLLTQVKKDLFYLKLSNNDVVVFSIIITFLIWIIELMSISIVMFSIQKITVAQTIYTALNYHLSNFIQIRSTFFDIDYYKFISHQLPLVFITIFLGMFYCLIQRRNKKRRLIPSELHYNT